MVADFDVDKMRLVKKWTLRQLLIKLVSIKRSEDEEYYKLSLLAATIGGAKKMPKRPSILTKNITDG